MTSPVSRAGRLAALAIAVSAAASCALLPAAGPTRNQLFAGSVQREGDAFVVEVTPRVTAVTATVPSLGFPPGLVSATPAATELIRPGDTLTLTVYENVPDGLLAGPGETASRVEDVVVDESGFIFIPYAGRIRAAGTTAEQVRQVVTRLLDEQTPDPQVIVSRTPGDGATVTVSGGVTDEGVYPIGRSTRMLSGMLATAGGLEVAPEIARVTVLRGGHSGTVWYEDIFRAPSADIALRAGDRIVVEEDTRAFTALGATGRQSRVSFPLQAISALEAIASVGGLDPRAANPAGVFVLRDEPEDIANAVLGRTDLVGTQRFVYVLDLTAPTGMFEARDFLIRDGDTVYVTTAPATAWNTGIRALTGSLEPSAPVVDAAWD